MKNKPYGIPFFIFFLAALLSASQKVNEKDLALRYQEWLKLTKYIIHEKEREVFMQLTNDRDRDIFMETFWNQRDPTPGTPRNEYKEEILERFQYVNKFFKRGTSREGWMTDMGKIYMILGPPISKDDYPASKGIYPCDVWSYYGDIQKGLPPHFSLVFFQRGGSGEYKLYDPVSDGPVSLLIQGRAMDPFDYPALYEAILELAPTLAPVTLSYIPGEVPYGYQPSPQNAIILAEILESPKKNINPVYATHFLNYRGVVSTEYLTNYVENEAMVSTIQDPILNIDFLHFSMEPKSLSIDYYEPKDQYYFTFDLDVSLRKGEEIIFQYSKNFPYYFQPEDLDKIRGNGIAIEDSFPIIEGKYKLTVLLRNPLGKEFSIFEKDVIIDKSSQSPQITSPILGYKFQNFSQDLHIPFKVLDKKLVVDPINTFGSSDSISFFFTILNVPQILWENGKVNVFIRGLKPNNPSQKSFILRLKDSPFRRALVLSHSFPAKELSPDYYEIKLVLSDEKGKAIGEKSTNFIVSAEETIPHPISHSKAFSTANSFLYYYMLAQQYENVEEYANAEASFEKAFGIKPEYKEGLINYAHFLLKTKKFGKALDLIENVKEDGNWKFDYHLVKGKAYMGMGQYSEAIKNLLEGNKIYNSDIGLLNALGFCYFKTGEKKSALDVLKASLRLNPEQKEIKELVAEIEKSRE